MIHENYITFAAQLQDIPDPRNRRGQSYEWQYLLIIVASAVMAGQRSVRAMAEWAAEQALAALRNGLLALLRSEGWPSPPTAFRHFRIHVQHALRLLGAIAT